MKRLASTLATVVLALGLLAGPRVEAQVPEPECAAGADLIEAIEAWLDAQPAPVPLVEALLQILARIHADACVRLNQVQVLGTHNSYHLQPSDALLGIMTQLVPAAEAWEYSHLPLNEQLGGQGSRQVELDVFADPQGGRFFLRLGPLLSGESIFGPLDLLLPGMKVLHVQHVDFETTCTTLIACLRTLVQWTDANPDHLPVMILVEAKDAPVLPNDTVPFDAVQFDALDAEIRSVFPPAKLFTPDDLRAGAATLEEVVLGTGWPALGDLRGRFLFALDNGGAKRAIYRQGRPALEGRVMFTNSFPGQADAAFVKVNDPLADPGAIPALVAQGYLVRTRADTDTIEARSGDTTRRDAALASGAQFVSTDFPAPSTRPGFTGYFVEIPGAEIARCNPVNAPVGCRDAGLTPARARLERAAAVNCPRVRRP